MRGIDDRPGDAFMECPATLTQALLWCSLETPPIKHQTEVPLTTQINYYDCWPVGSFVCAGFRFVPAFTVHMLSVPIALIESGFDIALGTLSLTHTMYFSLSMRALPLNIIPVALALQLGLRQTVASSVFCFWSLILSFAAHRFYVTVPLCITMCKSHTYMPCGQFTPSIASNTYSINPHRCLPFREIHECRTRYVTENSFTTWTAGILNGLTSLTTL